MTPELLRTIREVRARVAAAREKRQTVGLVPTMGSLHQGHGSLMERARRECLCLVVSIFVNPIQFNRKDDYDRYPRTLSADLEFCAARGVDVVFAPDAEEMYPAPPSAFVEVSGVSENLCGRFRPGHFRGVATVVAKLFHIVQPDRAYFGEKDAQQLAVIRRMVADLNMPVEIVGLPTVREKDGLALSSRNVHLTPEERLVAPALYRALEEGSRRIAAGAADPDLVKRDMLLMLEKHPQLRLEYLEIVDPEQMRPVESIAGPVRLAVAAWLGSTRLIDNVLAVPRRTYPDARP